jgi:dTDP-4-amino-4,6-dideoxygalactose transaminase
MILMNDFRREAEALRKEELLAVERVLNSGRYILGQEVQSFEKAWAQQCGAPFAIGVGNGMDALELGLRALNIGAGDEVITTSMTAAATVLAILRCGAQPVLADIELETALLDPMSVERCFTPKTKAILLVHLYGRIHKVDFWKSWCTERGVFLLEDCAQAHLASQDGKVAGTFGDWGAFSFYPTKNLGAIGDAGALVTHSTQIADRVRILRNYGQDQTYHHKEPGLNSRLDELQAALLSVRLGWLKPYTSRRREIASLYLKEISNPCVQLLQPTPNSENHVYHLFVVRCSDRQKLQKHLEKQEIQTLVHYPIPFHQQPISQNIRRDPRGLPNAETHAVQCLSLPCHPQLSDEDVFKVISVLNEFTGA